MELERFPSASHYPQADGSVKLAAGWLIDVSVEGITIGGGDCIANRRAD